MNSLVHVALVVAVSSLPVLALAQEKNSAPETDDRPSLGSDAKETRDRVKDLQAAVSTPSPRKAVRPEKTFGPDLPAFVAGPVGAIVAPINEVLHAFDAAVAPLDTALRPITGPLNPAPVSVPSPTTPNGNPTRSPSS